MSSNKSIIHNVSYFIKTNTILFHILNNSLHIVWCMKSWFTVINSSIDKTHFPQVSASDQCTTTSSALTYILTGLVIAMIIANVLTALLCLIVKMKSGMHAIVDAQIHGQYALKTFHYYVYSLIYRLLHSWSEKEKDTVITPCIKKCVVCVCVICAFPLSSCRVRKDKENSPSYQVCKCVYRNIHTVLFAHRHSMPL